MREPGVETPGGFRALVRTVERVVLVSALAVGALVFFRPTRPIGRVLLALWFVVAWPLAWVGRAVDSARAPAGGQDSRRAS